MDHFIHPSTLVRYVYKSQARVIQQNIPDNTRTFIGLPFLIGVLQPRLNRITSLTLSLLSHFSSWLGHGCKFSCDYSAMGRRCVCRFHCTPHPGPNLTSICLYLMLWEPFFHQKQSHWSRHGLFFGITTDNISNRQLWFPISMLNKLTVIVLWFLIFFFFAFDYNC